MSLYNSAKGIFDKATAAANSLRGVGTSVEQARNTFGQMAQGQMPHSGLFGNPSVAQGKKSYIPENYENEEDDENGYNPYLNQQELRTITDDLRKTFQRYAKLKFQIIVGKLRDKNNRKRVIAKLIVENTGDKEIAKKYQDYDDDELKDLDKSDQLIIRNQKHLVKIDKIKIDEETEMQCIDFFVMEFEEEYLAGREPDFKGIDPMELIIQKYSEPYSELIADFVIDYGLDLKPKAIEFCKALYIKILGKNAEQNLDTVLENPSDQLPEQPTAEVIENSILPEISTDKITEDVVDEEEEPESDDEDDDENEESSKAPLKRWGVNPVVFPDLEVEHFQEFLQSKGLDYDDILYSENQIFEDAQDKIKFLKEFDKFAKIRSDADETE